MLRLDWVITNGYVDIDTINKRTEKGWKFVTTLPANQVHPHALPTDKITVFSYYETPDGPHHPEEYFIND